MKLFLILLIFCIFPKTSNCTTWKVSGNSTSNEIPVLRKHIMGHKYKNPCSNFPTQKYNGTHYKVKSHAGPWIRQELDKNGWSCFYYECLDGYAYRSTNDRTCIQCPDKKNAETGICGDCPAGTIAGDIISGCMNKNIMKTYTKQQLKECFIFTNPPDYKICVMGCPTGSVRRSNERFKSDGETPNPEYVQCINEI